MQLDFAFVIVDKQVLKATIDAANACGDEVEAAIPEVQDIFNEALEAANTVYADIHATQAEIDQAWSDLMDALHLLSFEEGDTSALESLIDVADLIDLDQYFGDKDAFTEALEAAKDVCGEEHPLAADVDEAYNNLYDAMMSLTRLADKSSCRPPSIRRTALTSTTTSTTTRRRHCRMHSRRQRKSLQTKRHRRKQSTNRPSH